MNEAQVEIPDYWLEHGNPWEIERGGRLRLWKSVPVNEFDFAAFNSGDYYKALEARQKAEYITSVLYPKDSTEQGK